ncbi:hypothetical protein CI109_100142 [Kwoniella shandongensis]|uniref:Uncharacterized protein n=1 Tax=Kwoniella shandongensis TaxID=1734106 RepID=A0A5M6BXX6_9TREE|nr:uncharacterized protein CI109_005740 [Kwoniella shandongensis]KAA5525859.1 hypothetical protein CI109_005740 [Kwoniella shandongensis]
MSLSAHLVEFYEQRQPQPIPQLPLHRPLTPLQRPAHLAIPSHSTPLQRMNNRAFGMGMGVDPNESSWLSQHGGGGNQSFSTQIGGVSQWSEERIQMLQARLARKLGPEYVTTRPGPGGSAKLSYIEGWKVINLANEVFGFNGWSSSIVTLHTDYLEENAQGRVSCNITAVVRITLQDGAFHEDVGCGQGENIRGKGAALDKAKKEAVTDATKRALRTFGNVLGNCLYDKDYTKAVAKMTVPAAKFNQADLERRPEFTEAGANAGPSRGSAIPQHMNNAPKAPAPIVQPQPNRPQARDTSMAAPGTPLRSVYDPEDSDVFMDESFDAEFIPSESLLESLEAGNNPYEDMSRSKHVPQAGPSRPTEPYRPTYQHRHRPDATSAPTGQQQAPHPNTNNPAQSRQLNQRPQFQQQSGTGQSSRAGPSNNTSPTHDGAAHKPSSGDTSIHSASTVGEGPSKTRAVGGFAYPGAAGPSNANAASARAQAIASALNAAAAPIRSESPRIPSGGVDFVAAKATTKLRAEGVQLKLDENGTSEEGVPVTLSGFSSARGVKRRSGEHEERSASPTKPSSGQSTHSAGNRGGPRTALGELPVGAAQDDWAKRSRMG